MHRALLILLLLALLGGPSAASLAAAGPALSVDVAADRHPIDPAIYGMNFPPAGLAAELGMAVQRWGGNATTRYSWQLGVSNRGSDYFFQNVPEAVAGSLPDGSSVNQLIEQGRAANTATLITVPLIGWTPKRRLDEHPYDCGFSIRAYGPQTAFDPYDPDCGSGLRPGGSRITDNDPTDTSVSIGPSYVTSWMDYLIGRYGGAAAGGIRHYSLDNEPGIWHETHRDVHPAPLSYNEIRDLSVAYATAIKARDSGALTFGPVQDSWTRYYYASFVDFPQATADRAGRPPFVAWYLDQLRQASQASGTRLLDYLDLHYYPAATGVTLSPAGDAATQARRLRSTRSLWDPSYADESYIGTDGVEGGPAVRLIPRMRDWVAESYPGTKLAITEYNFGGLEHINGALAQADVLGIFGRERLDLATLWAPPQADQPGAFAFRIYRSYDGAGGRFGETSVRASSADQSQLAIYAAERASDGALTLVVINKTSDELTSSLSLAGYSPAPTAALYRYSAANLAAIVPQADLAVAAGGLSASFPANSVSLIVLRPASEPPPVQDRLLYAPLIVR
jgi:Glycoside hydrolase family 44